MVSLISLCCSLYGLIFILQINQTAGQYNVTDLTDCVFPFEMNGERYDSCITYDKKYPWCSLTKYYKGVWKYCQDMTKTSWTCATGCANTPTDKYPSCKTESGSRLYCINEVLDLSKKPVGSCEKKYKDVSPFHTACLPPQPYVAKTGVTEDEKTQILDLHNSWRRAVAVPAAGMPKMYWDDTLQMLAQKHAERCSFAHDDMDWRSIPGTGKETGQNIVMITGPKSYNFTHVFNDMFNGESKRWRYAEGIKKEFEGKHALHYTQIILDQISTLGCGYAECVYPDRIEKSFVCNYDHLQSLPETKVPYVEGQNFCDACPNKCDDKLCDCKGKQCYNGGVLDLNTCKCQCKGFWKGSDCSVPIVPVENDLGCMIPYMYEGKLQYKCVYDVIDGYFCSKTAYYTGNVEYCDDEHFDESLMQKRYHEDQNYLMERRHDPEEQIFLSKKHTAHESNSTLVNMLFKLFPNLAKGHSAN